MTELAAMGVRAELDDGWEGEIYRRADIGFGSVAALGTTPADGAFYPTILHLATFALPAQRGDFGGGALTLMGRAMFLWPSSNTTHPQRLRRYSPARAFLGRCVLMTSAPPTCG